MKKSVNILIGILCPAFFCFVFQLMLLWNYNEKYEQIQSEMLFVLPAIPGVALAFLLIRNSLRDFFKSLGICFLTSVCFFGVINVFNLNIYTYLTGFEDFSLGGGLLMVVMLIPYTISCFCGVVIAGIVSFLKKRKSEK